MGSLAEALQHTLSLDLAARRVIGQQARAAVLASFTTAAMQQATLDVYGELLI